MTRKKIRLASVALADNVKYLRIRRTIDLWKRRKNTTKRRRYLTEKAFNLN